MFEILGVLIGVGGVIVFGFISSGVWKKEKKYCLKCNNDIKESFKDAPYDLFYFTKFCRECQGR
tara:strand:- start:44 stop:235 length:192 start_codon:yes stop_codon:yes gene_type:complete